MTNEGCWYYSGKVEKIVDGDTMDVMIDLGFHIYKHQRIRLHQIDTPEMNSRVVDERKAARRAKDRLIELCPIGSDIIIYVHKLTGKSGRCIATAYCDIQTDKGMQNIPVQNVLIHENLGVFKNYDRRPSSVSKVS